MIVALIRSAVANFATKVAFLAFPFAIAERVRYIGAGAFAVCSRGSRRRSHERPQMYTPQHVANFFIDCANRDGRSLDPLKLIKLVYIAYGWVLALTNKRLFNERIEAWKHGPVIPSIYHEFKNSRYSQIDEKASDWNMETGDFVTPEVPASDPTTRMILEKVWAAYSGFSGWALRNKTHEPDTPWSMTYDGSMSKVIPDDLISSHFHQKIREIVDAARVA